MAAIPYMPLYVADYLGDAGHLTTAQHGAYLLLLMNYWQRGKGLPANDAALMSITRMSKSEWEKNKPAVLEFFNEVDGILVNKRSDVELARFRDKSAQSSQAANARWESVRKASGCNADAMRTNMPTQCHTDTDTSKKKTPKPPSTQKRRGKAAASDPDDELLIPIPCYELPAKWLEYAIEKFGWDKWFSEQEFRKLLAWAEREDIRRGDWIRTWQKWVQKVEQQNPGCGKPKDFKPAPYVSPFKGLTRDSQ